MAGNPHGGIAAKMRRLQQEFQQKADALGMALEIVNGHDKQKKADQHEQLFEAVRLDAARRKRRGPYKVKLKGKTAKQGSATSRPKITLRAAKQKQAIKFLKKFDRETPRRGGQGVSIYIQHGYLAKKGDGVIRTDKPYPPPA
jgi:hypothetical protein